MGVGRESRAAECSRGREGGRKWTMCMHSANLVDGWLAGWREVGREGRKWREGGRERTCVGVAVSALRSDACRWQESAKLQEQITAYKEQLEKVNNFIELKSTLETQLAEKKRALEEEAKEHATHVSDLERKHVQASTHDRNRVVPRLGTELAKGGAR